MRRISLEKIIGQMAIDCSVRVHGAAWIAEITRSPNAGVNCMKEWLDGPGWVNFSPCLLTI